MSGRFLWTITMRGECEFPPTHWMEEIMGDATATADRTGMGLIECRHELAGVRDAASYPTPRALGLDPQIFDPAYRDPDEIPF